VLVRNDPQDTQLTSWSSDTEEFGRYPDSEGHRGFGGAEKAGVDQDLLLGFPLPLEDTLRERPLMRMVIQWCLRRSKRASTRVFLWKRSYHSG